MQNLPSETIIYISSFTGAVQIFLRQVCSQWRDILPVSETYHWLNKMAKEHNALSLLHLAMKQGLRINTSFFRKCIKHGNLQIADYLNTIDVDHYFNCHDLIFLDAVKWLYKNKYNIDYKKLPVDYTSFPLDVAEFLYCNNLCEKRHLDGSRLLSGDKRKMKLISSFDNELFIFACKFANISELKYVCTNHIATHIPFSIFYSEIDLLEKLKYLHEKGFRIDFQGYARVNDAKVLIWLYENGYNTDKASSQSENLEVLKWRESKGYKINVISTESIEAIKWSLFEERMSDKQLNKIGYISCKFDMAKLIINYSITRNIQLSFANLSSKLARYIIKKNFIKDIERFIFDIAELGNIKLIKEFCGDKVSYIKNFDDIIQINNTEMLDYFFDLGVPLEEDALDYASTESNSTASIKWLYSHGIKVKDEKTLREEYFPYIDHYCKRVFKQLHGI